MFPFYGDNEEVKSKELPLFTEVAWDFGQNKPIFFNGKPKMLEGNEALKTWCYKTLQVNRYKHEIYDWSYGIEFENLIGKNYSKQLVQSEMTRYIKESLLINPYIKGVSDINITFNVGLLTVDCNVNTIYGDIKIEEVNSNV